MTIGCDNYLGPDMSQFPAGQHWQLWLAAPARHRDTNLYWKQAVPSLGWQNNHTGAQAMIASDRQGEREKSNPTFSAAVVLTWHANLSALSCFLSRSLNNSLIRLEKMMMTLKLTGASIEIYRLLFLFLLLALLYHRLSLHPTLCLKLRNKSGQQVLGKYIFPWRITCGCDPQSLFSQANSSWFWYLAFTMPD